MDIEVLIMVQDMKYSVLCNFVYVEGWQSIQQYVIYCIYLLFFVVYLKLIFKQKENNRVNFGQGLVWDEVNQKNILEGGIIWGKMYEGSLGWDWVKIFIEIVESKGRDVGKW